MADHKNPEVPSGEEPEEQDPVQDPLARAEKILQDLPVEDAQDTETLGAQGQSESYGAAGDPVTEEEVAGVASDEADPLIAEEPELSEVSAEDGITGGTETEPEERIQAADDFLRGTEEETIAEAAMAMDPEAILAEDSIREDAPAQEGVREAELQADLQRLQAEYINYRRRVERDRATERDRTKGQLITELMPVLDDISSARQAGDLQEGPFAHIATRLESVLQSQGLEVLGEIGEAFDPNQHEAIMTQPHEEIPADHVAIVLRAGYRHGDRLLRAAQVMVSSGPDQG
ncbi:nucleotide exchange factor GrpE [Nesterenkonia sandarakina]|uniref:Protein GrpE n=1 Tax=Nesterenkonia sandarakina TaxID=272918 RepID=A0A7Z0E7V3_9MICC|nr:nucleotide exchange factor GrpE [Nesterenkonia sandarakina]NYJ16706.1 molecular chaperone GrpE [Nesterenkonia sandarakina]